MPIFISYSHNDKEFVEKLASNLVKHKSRVWVDQWELNVGDSIIDRVQDALQESSAIIIIISKSSMNSEWCKKELTSGFLRELEEKRVVVLPVLLEDAEMPIFLRGKMYADFRKNFDDGFRKILESVSSVTSDTQARIEKEPNYFTDWSMDWGINEQNLYFLTNIFVDHGVEIPYVVVTEIIATANKSATDRYIMHASNGKEWLGRYPLILMLGEFAEKNTDLHIRLGDNTAHFYNLTVKDAKTDIQFDVVVKSRWLGNDTGKDVLIDFGNHLILVKDHMKKTVKDFPHNFEEHF